MGDILIDNKSIYNLELNFIHYFSFLVKICFFLFMVGILNNKPQSLMVMNFFPLYTATPKSVLIHK